MRRLVHLSPRSHCRVCRACRGCLSNNQRRLVRSEEQLDRSARDYCGLLRGWCRSTRPHSWFQMNESREDSRFPCLHKSRHWRLGRRPMLDYWSQQWLSYWRKDLWRSGSWLCVRIASSRSQWSRGFQHGRSKHGCSWKRSKSRCIGHRIRQWRCCRCCSRCLQRARRHLSVMPS